MITITLPEWFAISLVIYLVLDIIARIVKLALNKIDNQREKAYRRHMRELIEEDRNRRYIGEWKDRK